MRGIFPFIFPLFFTKGNWEPKISPLFLLWRSKETQHTNVSAKPSKNPLKSPSSKSDDFVVWRNRLTTATARTKATSRKKKRGRLRPAPLLRESHVISSSHHRLAFIYRREIQNTNFPNNLNIGACNGEKKRGDNAKKDNRRKERKKRGIVKVVDKMNDDDESGARATTDDKDDDIIERTTTRGEEVSSSSSSCFVSFSLLRVVR